MQMRGVCRDDANDDEADDEDAMMQCIDSFAHKVRIGQRESQKQRARKQQAGPPPLTKAQIQAIVNKIASGEIKLPDLQEMNDKDLITIWALLDAGSAVNVVDFDKHLHGVKVRESTAQRRGVKYLTAGGSEIPNRGEGELQYKSAIGEAKSIIVQNASVGMPIISTSCMAKDGGGNDITYRANDGYITDVGTGRQTPVIQKEGVYFYAMQIPRSVVAKRNKECSKDFHGHAWQVASNASTAI